MFFSNNKLIHKVLDFTDSEPEDKDESVIDKEVNENTVYDE